MRRTSAHVILAAVAAIGAALSYASLYGGALPTFGPYLAVGFPLLVDALVLGASLQYVAGARVGRARAGWRLTAHAAIAGTLTLNALASPDVAGIPWHVTAPAVWAVLVELYARQALGDWRAEHVAPRDRIPARLWLTAPVESIRTWLRMARTAAPSHAVARLDVGRHAAAVEALRLAIGGRAGRRVRRVLRRQLRAGSLPPGDVLAALGWGHGEDVRCTPHRVLRDALSGILAPTPRPKDSVRMGGVQPVGPSRSVRSTRPVESADAQPQASAAIRGVVIRSAQPVSRSDVVRLTGLAEGTVKSALTSMVTAGDLIRTGEGRSTRYGPPDAPERLNGHAQLVGVGTGNP